MLWYTVANVSMGLQHTNVGVDAWRFISGLGIGVEIVTIDAYISEFAPRRIRGRAFALNQCVQFIGHSDRRAGLLDFNSALASWALRDGGAWYFSALWERSRSGLSAAIFPNRPRWLAQQGRLEEAGIAIAQIEARVEPRSGVP